MKKLTVLFIVLTAFISCKESDAVPAGNNFYFENPQPINDSELKSIPRKFQGVFASSDSVFLNVKENIIFTEKENKFRFHKNQIDSLKQDFNVVNGKYISKDSKEVFNSKEVGDSLEFSNKDIDTLFIFSDSNKAKRVNGHLILSKKESFYWKVKSLSLNKNSLIIKQLYSNEDLKRMDSITKIPSKKIDSISSIINPSRREFSKFLELKKFGFDQTYIKISD